MKKLPFITTALLSALLPTAAAAHPQAVPTATPTSGSGPSSCPTSCHQPRSAIATVITVAAAAVGRVPPKTLVAVAPLHSDSAAPRGQQLAMMLGQQLAGRLGASVRALTILVPLHEARQQAAKYHGLVYLQPRIEAGRLQLSVDAYGMPRTVWARAIAAEPGPLRHTFAQAPIDAEVRSYLRPLSFDQPLTNKYTGADKGILAMACGDIDGDGITDLVTVSRQRVLQVRLQRGKVKRVREARWKQLSAISGHPLREPLAFATIVEAPYSSSASGYIDVSLSDRAHSIRLNAAFNKQAELPGFALPSGRTTACTPIQQLQLNSHLVACQNIDVPPAIVDLKGPSDAFASGFIVTRAGVGFSPIALRVRSTLVLQHHGKDVIIGRVGAQLAVTDLDQDGDLDVITTNDVLNRKRDAVLVRTLTSSGTVKRRFELAVTTGVDALATCPPDGPGRTPFVIASGEEIWVVR